MFIIVSFAPFLLMNIFLKHPVQAKNYTLVNLSKYLDFKTYLGILLWQMLNFYSYPELLCEAADVDALLVRKR